MRNSVLLTSDLKSVILVDTNQEDQRLAIGKRGVLLSVLGADICATEVPAELDNYVSELLRKAKPFYEFDAGAEAGKSQLCITYNDANNAVFIIGITDVILENSGHTQLPKEKTTTFAVRMKDKPTEGLTSKTVILARLESAGAGIGSKKFIRFYYLSAS